MQDAIDVLKTLSDANRVRILCTLRGGELCVCQLIELLGLAPSTVSKHLSLLRKSRLIHGRKEGRWMLYRLPDNPSAMIRDSLDLVFSSVRTSAEIREDKRKLRQILKIDREKLCRAQIKRSGNKERNVSCRTRTQ